MPEVVSPEQTFAAQYAPVAANTWEVSATLAGNVQSTGIVPIEFARQVEIVGCYPSIVATSSTGLRAPTPDDLFCLLRANRSEQFTYRLERQAAAGDVEASVTLAALGVLAPRLMRIVLNTARPTIELNFRWKTAAPLALYEDALISVAFFCRYLSAAEIEYYGDGVGR